MLAERKTNAPEGIGLDWIYLENLQAEFWLP